MIRGTISEPITDGFTRIVRMAVIIGIALQIGLYNQFLSDWLFNSPERMAAYVSSGPGGPGASADSQAQYLDTLMSKAYDMGQGMIDQADKKIGPIPQLDLFFAGVLVIVAGAASTAYGAFLLALAKMSLAILLGIGPIFVLATIFEGTKRLFDTWLGQVLNYFFLVVLTAASIKLILTILESYLDQNGNSADYNIAMAIPVLLFGLIGALVLVQMPSIASALGGGVAVSTLGAVSWAYAKAGGVASGLRPQNIEKGINSIKRDIRATKRGVNAAKAMPAAVYRKITGADKNSVSKG